MAWSARALRLPSRACRASSPFRVLNVASCTPRWLASGASATRLAAARWRPCGKRLDFRSFVGARQRQSRAHAGTGGEKLSQDRIETIREQLLHKWTCSVDPWGCRLCLLWLGQHRRQVEVQGTGERLFHIAEGPLSARTARIGRIIKDRRPCVLESPRPSLLPTTRGQPMCRLSWACRFARDCRCGGCWWVTQAGRGLLYGGLEFSLPCGSGDAHRAVGTRVPGVDAPSTSTSASTGLGCAQPGADFGRGLRLLPSREHAGPASSTLPPSRPAKTPRATPAQSVVGRGPTSWGRTFCDRVPLRPWWSRTSWLCLGWRWVIVAVLRVRVAERFKGFESLYVLPLFGEGRGHGTFTVAAQRAGPFPLTGARCWA